MNKYKYKFEVEANVADDEGAIEVKSLESALEKLTSDGFIYATTHYPIEDGRIMSQVIKLHYSEIGQKSVEDLYKFLDRKIDNKRFQ